MTSRVSCTVSVARPAGALFALALCVAVAPPAPAASPPVLVTDRPDQTESSVTVPRGLFQVETGWTLTRDDEDGARTETSDLAATLLRIGLADRFELRVGWSGFVSEDVRVAGEELDSDGVGDTALGAKLVLREERSRSPRLALLVGSSVPTGGSEVTSDRFDPSFRLAASHTLSDRMGIGYNAGMAWESSDEGNGRNTLSDYLYTASLGIGVGDRTGVFVELYGEIPASADGGPAHALDCGLTHLVRDNLQLDASGGIGLSDDAADWFVGIGVSARLPR